MYRLTAIVAAALTLVGHVALANVVVDPANPGGWIFSDADNVPSTSAQ